MKRYKVIKNQDTGFYLQSIQISRVHFLPLTWTLEGKKAIRFENEEEAEATITFIGAVLDWELEEQLEICNA